MAREAGPGGRGRSSHRVWLARVAAALLVMAVPLTVAVSAGAKERLTAGELATRADAICAEAAEQLDPLFAELFATGGETPEASEAAPVLAEAERILSEEVRDLTALKPPRELRAEWHDVERLMRRLLHHARRAALLARQGDTEGYLTALAAANEVDAEARQAFERVGARGCARTK